jgi:mutator protein MutT
MDSSRALIIEDGRVVLIERRRETETYYLFPGGRIEVGETAVEAVAREIKEELGLDVVVGSLVAEVTYNGNLQSFFMARVVGGVFGSGSDPEPAVWLPVAGLTAMPVHPAAVALLVQESPAGWPREAVRLIDPGRASAA